MRLLVLFLLALVVAVAMPVGGADEVVYVARIDGVVSRGTALYIEQALEQAEAKGAILVIELDTPGGLVDATLEIDRLLARAEVPVLTYVGPGGGAFAASAGTFILLMGHPSGMAEGATIGSAQPIQVGPTGGAQNASSKVENFLVERIRSIAERTGRDADIAERFITENLNLEADEARAAGMVDIVAPDVGRFIAQADGMQARLGDGTVALSTADARIERISPGLLPRTVDILSDPTVAFILFLAGMYALVFGLANGGTYVPETIGAVLLMLGLVGLGIFGISTAGFLLLILAAVFFVAEVFTPTHGVLSAAGVVAIIVAAIFLFDGPLLPAGFQRRIMGIMAGLGIMSGGLVFTIVTIAMRTRDRPSVDRFRDQTAHVVDEDGRVELFGEVWQAQGTAGLPVGTPVRVVKRQGLVLFVQPSTPEDKL